MADAFAMDVDFPELPDLHNDQFSATVEGSKDKVVLKCSQVCIVIYCISPCNICGLMLIERIRFASMPHSQSVDGVKEEFAVTVHEAGAKFLRKLAASSKAHKVFSGDTFGATALHSKSSDPPENDPLFMCLPLYIDPGSNGEVSIQSKAFTIADRGQVAFDLTLPEGWGPTFLIKKLTCETVAHLRSIVDAGACGCALVSRACM
jgi:hypothetical protein